MKKKAWLSALAVVLVLCCAVGGTLAWLTQKTDAVVNTFTVGDINITLTERELNKRRSLSYSVLNTVIKNGSICRLKHFAVLCVGVNNIFFQCINRLNRVVAGYHCQIGRIHINGNTG